jgi:hypothetical protein
VQLHGCDGSCIGTWISKISALEAGCLSQADVVLPMLDEAASTVSVKLHH